MRGHKVVRDGLAHGTGHGRRIGPIGEGLPLLAAGKPAHDGAAAGVIGVGAVARSVEQHAGQPGAIAGVFVEVGANVRRRTWRGHGGQHGRRVVAIGPNATGGVSNRRHAVVGPRQIDVLAGDVRNMDRLCVVGTVGDGQQRRSADGADARKCRSVGERVLHLVHHQNDSTQVGIPGERSHRCRAVRAVGPGRAIPEVDVSRTPRECQDEGCRANTLRVEPGTAYHATRLSQYREVEAGSPVRPKERRRACLAPVGPGQSDAVGTAGQEVGLREDFLARGDDDRVVGGRVVVAAPPAGRLLLVVLLSVSIRCRSVSRPCPTTTRIGQSRLDDLSEIASTYRLHEAGKYSLTHDYYCGGYFFVCSCNRAADT